MGEWLIFAWINNIYPLINQTCKHSIRKLFVLINILDLLLVSSFSLLKIRYPIFWVLTNYISCSKVSSISLEVELGGGWWNHLNFYKITFCTINFRKLWFPPIKTNLIIYIIQFIFWPKILSHFDVYLIYLTFFFNFLNIMFLEKQILTTYQRDHKKRFPQSKTNPPKRKEQFSQINQKKKKLWNLDQLWKQTTENEKK